MAVVLGPLHRGLRFDVEAVREQLRDADGSALADAYLACVEAADSIGRALVREQQGDGHGAADDLHEALAAVRAASMSVRYSLVRWTDLARESAASSKVRT